MDHKMVKKMKKRKDLDKLLGDTRKHFRRKSGHFLLRTESQSSNSSDDFEHLNHLSAIRYKKSRCSSFIFYASICLSICTLIFCCVLFGLTFILRTHITQLQSELERVSLSAKEKSNQLQDVYSRLQTLQIYVHHLNQNITKQMKSFHIIVSRFNGIQKKFKLFAGYETLLGSLSNVPTQLKKISSMTDNYDRTMKQLRKDVDHANVEIAETVSQINSLKDKSPTLVSTKKNTSNVADTVLRDMNRRLGLLQLNVTDLREVVSNHKRGENIATQPIRPESNKSQGADRKFDQRLKHVETKVQDMSMQLKHFANESIKAAATSFVGTDSNAIHRLEKEINSNKKLINFLKISRKNTPAQDETPQKSNLRHDTDGKDKTLASVVDHLNTTLMRLQERLPKVHMTLGFGVTSNATFSTEHPLGHGVILKRDEYYKLRSFWAKASSSFTLSIQSMQRVDIMEKKFKKLKKQVISGIKNIKLLQAMGLKPTDRPVDPNRPDMEINVPVPVYTTPRDPSAPTPDPHLSLPWVKTARDAEINFYRWNRNGDDALSGDELDPAALRGFMGPYMPSMEQFMHFDVNNDHRLSKQEVLCMFGFIPWPCTGEVKEFGSTPVPKVDAGMKRNTKPTPPVIPTVSTPSLRSRRPEIKKTSTPVTASTIPRMDRKLSSGTDKPLHRSSTKSAPSGSSTSSLRSPVTPAPVVKSDNVSVSSEKVDV